LGHHFVLVQKLWLKRDTFETKIDETYDEKTRLDGGQVQGQLRDILAIIPDRYKGKVMRARWFEHAVSQCYLQLRSFLIFVKFLKGMQDQRYNTSTRIRWHAGALSTIAPPVIFLRRACVKNSVKRLVGTGVNMHLLTFQFSTRMGPRNTTSICVS
jgi:hypothetical protein